MSIMTTVALTTALAGVTAAATSYDVALADLPQVPGAHVSVSEVLAAGEGFVADAVPDVVLIGDGTLETLGARATSQLAAHELVHVVQHRADKPVPAPIDRGTYTEHWYSLDAEDQAWEAMASCVPGTEYGYRVERCTVEERTVYAEWMVEQTGDERWLTVYELA